MSKFVDVSEWIATHVPDLLAEHNVPAASVGILVDGEIYTFASGVLNKNTNVTADTESVFQIGSITKVWTATLVMQLVDEGKLDLDAPVRDTIGDFAIADADAAARITTRMLLSHTSGFEGDFFTDTGAGDDAVEKYLATLAEVPQLFAPGERFSYNNAAFVVLGRIVEVLRGVPYAQALRQYLATPLGLTHTATGPSEAIMFRAALGHIPSPETGELVAAPFWNLAPSNAPAGSMLAMNARDLLTFARMHLDAGTAADGTRVLSAASAAAMQEAQVTLPDLRLMGNEWGLGWELFDYEGGRLIGHDGSTVGQNAFLRIAPHARVAVALLTNGGGAFQVYETLFRHVLAELAGVVLPPLPAPTADGDPVNVERIVGTYTSAVSDAHVSVDDDGRIWLRRTMKGLFAEISEAPEPVELVGWRGDTLLPAVGQNGIHMPHAFVGDDGNGRAQYLHTGRADRRITA